MFACETPIDCKIKSTFLIGCRRPLKYTDVSCAASILLALNECVGTEWIWPQCLSGEIQAVMEKLLHLNQIGPSYHAVFRVTQRL